MTNWATEKPIRVERNTPAPEVWCAWVTLDEYPHDKVIALFSNRPIELGGFRLFLFPKWISNRLRARFGMTGKGVHFGRNSRDDSPRIVGFKSFDEIPSYKVGATVNLEWSVQNVSGKNGAFNQSVVKVDGVVIHSAQIAHPKRQRR